MAIHKLRMQDREKTAKALVAMRGKSTAIARLVHRRMCIAEIAAFGNAFGNAAAEMYHDRNAYRHFSGSDHVPREVMDTVRGILGTER